MSRLLASENVEAEAKYQKQKWTGNLPIQQMKYWLIQC